MIEDTILVCLLCGEITEMPSEAQMKIFKNALTCCESNMIKLDRNKIYKIIKSLDTVKSKLEAEIIKGM